MDPDALKRQIAENQAIMQALETEMILACKGLRAGTAGDTSSPPAVPNGRRPPGTLICGKPSILLSPQLRAIRQDTDALDHVLQH